MTTLDGVERELDPDMAMVCDAEGPSGIAGIMGGQISEVSDKTTRVLMEMATWVGPNILETSKRLGLRSEASARFEKQLHPDQAIAAQRLAARLMVELCGARMVPGTIDVYPDPLPPREVPLRSARVEKLLGEQIPVDESAAILARLGFDVPAPADEMEVGVPGFRDADVQREADLIEEVARIYGLDKLPTTLPAREKAVGRLTASQRLRRRIEDALRDRGLYEIVAWSFTSPEAIERPAAGRRCRSCACRTRSARTSRSCGRCSCRGCSTRRAATPRTTARARRTSSPRTSTGWRGRSTRPRARRAARCPPPSATTWRRSSRATSSPRRASSRGCSTRSACRSRSSRASARSCIPGGPRACWPGDEQKVGWIGELHPLVARDWDLEGGAAFELDVDALAELTAPARPGYRPVSTFPAVIQDIAVVVAEDVPAADVEDAVRDGRRRPARAGAAVRHLPRRAGGQGSKSLALRLEFRAPDRTLTDEEVAEVRARIESELAELGGKLRG